MKKFIPTLFLMVASVMPISANASFNQSLELEGVKFVIKSSNESSLNNLNILVTGIEGTKSISRDVDGMVVGAEAADLNSDGYPELYVYVSSVGSGSYGSVIAFASNKNKSMSEIYIPPVDENSEAFKGYMGHDEFAIIELTLARRFPIYNEGDINAKPTGGTRQIEYKLEKGEAGWVMKIKKSSKFD